MWKKSKLKIMKDKILDVIKKTNEYIEKLGENTNNLYNTLNNIQDKFDEIRNIPQDKKLEYEKIKKIKLDWRQQVQKIEDAYKANIAKNAGLGVVGTGVGISVVTLGPTAAMGVATTFGVASTGTAISTLSGAAATNAALAWLGGGTLATGGGGIAAGKVFLALAGPIGWSIAGATVLVSGVLFWRTKSKQKCIEKIFYIISERDERKYKLAIVELKERINRIISENEQLNTAIERIKTFGTDYNKMSEAQQYELGSYVNLMSSSTQLLVNPIHGLQQQYTDEDFNKYIENSEDNKKIVLYRKYKNLIIYLANLLYKIELEEKDKKLLFKTLRKNKEMLKDMGISRKEFDIDLFNIIFDVLKYKYKLE